MSNPLKDGEFGEGGGEGEDSSIFPLAAMDKNESGNASPQLLLSSYLFLFLENCMGLLRKIEVK